MCPARNTMTRHLSRWPASKKLAGIFFISALLSACDPGTPSGELGFNPGGEAAPLTQAEFNALPPEQQYQVASKLYGTLYRGITADEFFDLEQGMDELVVAKTNFINDTRNQLSTNLQLEELQVYDSAIDGLDEDLSNPDADLARYRFDTDSELSDNERARQIPLARIKDYPISRDLYTSWMAYFLANTIQYSPAEEMESTDMQDVQRMYRFLYNNIKDKATIRAMVRSNLSSLARWRVARTPQNAALEAFENYLGLFQEGGMTEEEKALNPVLATLPQSIENAGTACRDLFLTRADDGYLLASTDFPNTSPVLILEDSFVTNCSDVYDVISGHSLIIPRAVEMIINYFMPGDASREKRLAVSQAIVNANPETYEDIITAILFSKAYLLDIQRPKSFEENFLPLLDTLKWDVKARVADLDRDMFMDMASNEGRPTYLGGMAWNTMSLKIGRIPNVPLDALSFANYHKAMRETLLTNARSYQGAVNDETGAGLIFDEEGEVHPFIANLDAEEYIDYLFLNTLHRKATTLERDTLFDYLVDVRNFTTTETIIGIDHEKIRTNRYNEFTEIVLDYVSRLPELYYFTSVSQSEGEAQ